MDDMYDLQHKNSVTNNISSKISFGKWLLNNVFVGEVYFALFITAGTFKSVFKMQSYIDLTLLFMILSLFSAIKRLYRKPFLIKESVGAIILFLCIDVFMIFSLTYSGAGMLGINKVITFTVIVGWCYVGGVILVKSDSQLLRFLNTISVIAIIMIIDVVMKFSRVGGSTFIQAIGTNYLNFSRLAATLCITVLSYYTINQKSKKNLFVNLIIIVTTIFAMTVSGARGPLFVIIIIIIFSPLLSFRISKTKVAIKKWGVKLLFIIVFFAIVGGILLSLGYFDFMVRRTMVLFEETDDSRKNMVKYALEMWKEKPILGWGIEGFSISYNNRIGNYPHNIILEMLSELGIFSIFPFFIMIILSLRKSIGTLYFYSNSDNLANHYYLQLALVGNLIFWLTLIVFSSLTEARLMFAFICLGIISPSRKADVDNI